MLMSKETTCDLEKLEIRNARIEDLAGLSSLSRSVRKSQFAKRNTPLLRIDRSYLEARLSKGMMLVATIGKSIVGVTTMMLGTYDDTKRGYDSVTMVAPRLTRKGIGEKLLRLALSGPERMEWN